MFQDLTQTWSAPLPGMDWVSGCQQFLVIATFSIWLSVISSGKIRKNWKIVSQAQSLLSRSCVMTGFGSKFSSQKCVLYTLWEHLWAFSGPLDSHRTKTKTMHTRSPKRLRKTPSNHVIAVSRSPYRFPWFATTFSTIGPLMQRFLHEPLRSLLRNTNMYVIPNVRM